MPKFYHQYPVVQIDPGALAKEVTLLQVLANQTNGDQLSQQVDASGNVQPAGDITARGVFVRPTDGTDSQEYTASGEALVLVTPLTSASTVTVVQPTGSNLHVDVDASALPTGAATAANQATEIASLASIDGKLTAPLSVTGPLTDTELRASAVPISAASLPLPTGAATQTTLANIDNTLALFTSDTTGVNGGTSPNNIIQVAGSDGATSTALLTDSAGRLQVDSSLASGAATAANRATEIASLASIDGKLTAPLSVTGPLTDTELRASAVPVSATSLPLPTGAATEATLAAASAKLPATLGQKTMANSLAVVLASDQSAIPVTQGGSTPAYTVFFDYAATPVLSGVWGIVVGSSPVATTRLEIFDSSGQALYLGYGIIPAQVEQFIIFPGGNGSMSLATPSSTRISVKPITGDANSGFLVLNFFN